MANNNGRFETVGDLADYLATLDRGLPLFIKGKLTHRPLEAKVADLVKAREESVTAARPAVVVEAHLVPQAKPFKAVVLKVKN